MANATDPSPWPVVPLSDRQRQLPNQSPAAQQPSDGSPWLLSKEVRAEEELEPVELSTAIRNLFDSGRDQVVWNLPPSRVVGPPGSEQYLRLDSRHGFGPAIARSINAAKLNGKSDNDSWLIIVDEARNLLAEGHAEQLQAALSELARVLVVACETEVESAVVDAPDTISQNVAEMSRRLRVDYVGPIGGQDSSRLLEALGHIKQIGRPSFLHLKTSLVRGPSDQPFSPDSRPDMPEDLLAPRGLIRQTASDILAELAREDARIIAVSTDLEPAVLQPWQALPNRLFPVEAGVSHALQWCASLSAGGSRPFAFLSWDELQNSFGDIRKDICLKRAGVTLVIEPRNEQEADAAVSSTLAGIRQLPNTSLLAPKNLSELRQMLAWCAAQQDPAVICVPNGCEPRSAWESTNEISGGQAELLAHGRDVAIVAWGPMVAAAQIAANNLAESNIRATIVNARFAQPLDIDTIARAARSALCVVIVDDVDAAGGFSGWVVEQLLHAGITQPVTIVAPQERRFGQHPYDLHKQCALRIVERCRWLADPIEVPQRLRIVGDLRVAQPESRATNQWFAPLGSAAANIHDEQRQVLAQQFSPFIEQWVREYSKVGTRDVYLWRWCLHGLGLTTLSCVAPRLRQDLCETKLLAVMYGVMLDDVADQGGEEVFLRELTKIINGIQPRDFSQFSPSQQAYARFTGDLWECFESRLRQSPCYTEFEELLDYDQRQILNTMSYSCMVNRHPALLNLQEHDMYLPHNMQMMSFATMDLMCSPEFDRRELGSLREVIWHAQSMGRIGNLVSTWQREIADRDFTSGVFARALRQGDLTLEDLRCGTPRAIEAAIRRGGHESYFLEKWESHRKCIQSIAASLHSVDVGAILVALERLIHMELGSRGLK